MVEDKLIVERVKKSNLTESGIVGLLRYTLGRTNDFWH